ncbi:hypothetical protein F511_18280 [Dorcoceras hygrometricum]|uniref:Uncharacterized protein n=1 Tax=Dorcoceras hygrometricum TaxID=472368 RepID=A0A2Z7CUX6_9LAMI|nr:hypothetical protein F511_18280 [Dorcoceras hygrometricum]
MQVETALSVLGPKPTELSTVTQNFGPSVPGSNGKQRTSSLEAPIMLLSGHQSAIYTMKFNPAGTIIASGSHDRDIFLWNMHGDCKNFMVLRGHKNAVLDIQWTTDGSQIISASPDKSLRAWDVETGKQIKKMIGHLSVVNSCCPARRGPPLIVSGSDDGTAKLWDMRQRGSIQSFPDKYQITAVSFSDASDKIYTGGIDNDVKVWDLRRTDPVLKLQGHQDMITGMQLSPDGSYLLTNSMDCSLRIWDMRPYAPQNRCVKILEGHQHNFERICCDVVGHPMVVKSPLVVVTVWCTFGILLHDAYYINFQVIRDQLTSVFSTPRNLLLGLAAVISRYIWVKFKSDDRFYQ